jgi:DNA-binding SARP family transcriptional activator
MSQLRLSLLGPPQVWADDTPLTFATRKALALLIYLVVEGGAQPRDKLLALLWSDRGPERGRGVLRTTLALTTTWTSIRWNWPYSQTSQLC